MSADLPGRLVVVNLDDPSQWSTAVWQAFEKASNERTARNIAGTDARRHEGNKHEVSSVRFQGTEPTEAAVRIAEHTGNTEFLSVGSRSFPVKNTDAGWADQPGAVIGPRHRGVESESGC